MTRAIKKISPEIRILSQITGIAPELIYKESNIVKDLKFDSLMRIELAAAIEKKFGFEIDEACITSKTSVADLEKLIQEKPKKILKYKLRAWPRLFIVGLVRKVLQDFVFFPIILNLLTKIEVQGIENIKNIKTPVIIAANHLSDLDTPVIFKSLPAFIREKLAVATATDILYEKLWYAQPLVTLLFNTYPFLRVGQIRSGLLYTEKLLSKGWSILIYPEGGISETGKLLPFKMGIGLICVKTRVPVIPIRTSGAQEILPIHWQRRGVKKLRGKVIVKIGKPLYFKKGTAYEAAAKVIEKTIRTI